MLGDYNVFKTNLLLMQYFFTHNVVTATSNLQFIDNKI